MSEKEKQILKKQRKYTIMCLGFKNVLANLLE